VDMSADAYEERDSVKAETRRIEAAKEARKKADAEAKRKADKAAREQREKDKAARKLEMESVPMGREAAAAARELNLPDRFAKGFEKLGTAIAKKGDASGDAALADMMSAALERLIQAAEANNKGGDENVQKLRKVEQQLENLTEIIRNSRNP